MVESQLYIGDCCDDEQRELMIFVMPIVNSDGNHSDGEIDVGVVVMVIVQYFTIRRLRYPVPVYRYGCNTCKSLIGE